MKENLQKGDMIGSYKLISQICVGNFAETWKAVSPSKATVAVQIIRHPSLIEEIGLQEIDIHPITSPSVAQMLAVEKDVPAFVWKYHNGRRLQKFIKELGKIKLHVVAYIARKILETHIFTASRGKFHGALRPTRVLVTPEKRVVLTNFGMGFLEQRVLAKMPQEERQRFAHILPYFPQEVLEDELFDDPKGDIYTVGIIMSEMLSGKLVPGEEVPQQLAACSIKGELYDIVCRAVADFSERYHHPREMYQQITRLLRFPKEAETLIVPPPRPNIQSMEAIPADSEEYRVYQAQVFSAKQTIDGDVMAAEPVDSDGEIAEQKKISARLSKKVLPEQEYQDICISTIDDEIMQHLDRKSIWPDLSLSYIQGISFAMIALACLAYFFPLGKSYSLNTFLYWPWLPLVALSVVPWEMQMFFGGTLFFLIAIVLFLPLIDADGMPATRRRSLFWAGWAFVLCMGMIPVTGDVLQTILTYAAASIAIIVWCLSVHALNSLRR